MTKVIDLQERKKQRDAAERKRQEEEALKRILERAKKFDW